MLTAFRQRSLALQLTSVLAILLLAGCQSLSGPVWSPDGKRVAYTTYEKQSSSPLFTTNVYLLESDDEKPEPLLLGEHAACPAWSPDGSSLYFIGDRDEQGFYRKLFRYRMNTAAPEIALRDIHVVNFQMTVDGTLGILCDSQTAQMGGPVSVELWQPQTGKRTPLTDLGQVYSPALMPNGKAIVYAQKPVENLAPLLFVSDLENGVINQKEKPLVLFPTKDQSEAATTPFVVHVCPDSEHILFFSPGATSVWGAKFDDRDGSSIVRYTLPPGESSPVIVAIAEDSGSATLACMRSVPSKVSYDVFKLDFASKKMIRLDGNSDVLLGGHVLDPHAARRKGGSRYAWICGAGLALGEPGHAMFFPADPAQCIAASALQIKQHEFEKSVETAMKARELKPLPEDPGEMDRAEARAFQSTKNYVRAGDAFERGLLLFPVGPDGLRYVFGKNSGMPTYSPSEMDAASRELDELIKTVPGNALLTILKQAMLARYEGRPEEALALYEKAYPICPDEARHGGVRFLEGMCALEAGDLLQAAERWEAAAHNADFPQADYAAGLSALAFMLDGRQQIVPRAGPLLQLPAAKNSVLRKEYASLLVDAAGRSFRNLKNSKDSTSADKTVSAHVDIEECMLPYANVNPVQMQGHDAEGQETLKLQRVGLRKVLCSSLSLGDGQPVLLRIPHEIDAPVFSPDNELLAFPIRGDIPPLSNVNCDIMVLTRAGQLLLGSPNVVARFQARSRFWVSSLEWTKADELKVSGQEVDVFGGQTPFTRTFPLPHRP